MVEWKLTTAVLLALSVEAAGVLMWAGATSERLTDVEARVADQAELVGRLARLEVQLEVVNAQLGRIEKVLAKP